MGKHNKTINKKTKSKYINLLKKMIKPINKFETISKLFIVNYE